MTKAYSHTQNVIFLSCQLTELSPSPRSPPLLEHQRASEDTNRLSVKRRTQEWRRPIENKSVALQWSSSVMVLVNLFIEFLHSSLSCGPSPRLSRIQESALEFLQSVICVSCLLHLTELLKYLPAVGDPTLALNIVLYMHHTEALIVPSVKS